MKKLWQRFRRYRETVTCKHEELDFFYHGHYHMGHVKKDNPDVYQITLWGYLICSCCGKRVLVGEMPLSCRAEDAYSVTEELYDNVLIDGKLIRGDKIQRMIEEAWFSDDIVLKYRHDNSSDMVANILTPNSSFVDAKRSLIDFRKFYLAEVDNDGFSNYTLDTIAK